MNIDDIGNFYEDVFIGTRATSVQATGDYLRAKVRGIFTYENLPESLPQSVLEGMLVTAGEATIYEHDGELYATETTPSSEPDIYGNNTRAHIRHDNQRLDVTIGETAVSIKNDPLSLGLESLITEYAIMTAQAKISILRSFPMLRSHYILQAKDQDAYDAATEYEAAIRRGDMAVILAEEIDDISGMTVHQTPPPTNAASQIIELYQYVQATYYGELGINLTNNMKREYVSDSEISRSTGMPLIHVMLTERQNAIEQVNELFDTDISVEISQEWNRELNPKYNSPEAPEAYGGDDGGMMDITEEGEPENAEDTTTDDAGEDGDTDNTDEDGDEMEAEEEDDEEEES